MNIFIDDVASVVGGLLDSYATNMWGAYGLQKLLTAYSASAIRVRRSSDDSEQDIGFSGEGVDVASLLSFCGTGNGFVVTWYDQSGNGNDIGQASSTLQPKIVSGGVFLLHIEFDGSNDYLVTTNNSGTPTAMTVFHQGRHRTFPGGGVFRFICQHSEDFNVHKSCYIGVLNGTFDGFNYGISDGTGNHSVATHSDVVSPVSMGVVSGRFDKTSSGGAKRKVFYAGSVLSDDDTSSAGVVGTGAFDALPWYLGGVSGDVSPQNSCTFVIYEDSFSNGDIASITSALSTGADPYFDDVSFLCHFDGTDGAATFVDTSNNGHTIVVDGAAEVDTSIMLADDGSLLLTGTGASYLHTSADSLDFTTGDFTIEFWLRPASWPAVNGTIVSNYGAPGGRGLDVRLQSDGTIGTRWSSDGTSDYGSTSSTVTVPVGTNSHVAVVRNGTSLKVYIDGVGNTGTTISVPVFSSATPAYIGCTPDVGAVWLFDGRIDELRVTKFARYTGDFSVPSAPFPDF